MLVSSSDYRELSATIWSELPARLRGQAQPTEWARVNRPAELAKSFLEGPEVAPDGTLYCVDIPYGRVFSVSGRGWEVVCEYDGWPNGLKLRPNGQLLVADARQGLVEIDPAAGSSRIVLGHRNTQRFLGVNDLQLSADGAVWFTDQGQTGLHDPAGRVYRWDSSGVLACVLDHLPSPNGLRVTPDGRELYVAVTRDNSIWRAPLSAQREPSKVGRFAMFYGPTGPDGLHIDSGGCIWVCLPGADTVWVLNRKAEVQLRVRFPDGAFPTNLAMDEERRVVYVTCAGAQAIFTVRGY